MDTGATPFKQLEIMGAPFAEACSDELLCFPVEQPLRL